MLSETSTPCSSPHPVLPPIIKNERDRLFLKALTKSIDHEMRKISPRYPEQKYILYKDAFDKLIEHVSAYKPILTAIKAEYEDCIETIIRGKQQAFYLNGKLKALASEPTTMRNYKKRIDELEQRISVVRENNQQLAEDLQDLNRIKEEREAKLKQIDEPLKKVVKTDSRQIPGFTIEQNTDLDLLKRELVRVDKQLRELVLAEKSKFQPREIKESLQVQLVYKTDLRDKLTSEDIYCKDRMSKLKIALEAAQIYNKIRPPHQTVGAVIATALKQAEEHNIEKYEKKQQNADKLRLGSAQPRQDTIISSVGTSSSSLDDDDPAREQEADAILDYIEKFNDLFNSHRFEAAAIHAANSPRGILRNMETLAKFKEAESSYGEREPLLAYCDAIMSSVLAIGVIPSEAMCMECVICALKNHRLDLLSHWIAQDRLKMTEDIGNLIYETCTCRGLCKCGCQGMAQKVYTIIKLHKKVVACLIRQGRVVAAVEYADQKADFSTEDYKKLLETYPSVQLAQALFEGFEDNRQLLPLGVVLKTLLDTDIYEQGFQLLNTILQGNGGAERLHDLVLSDKVSSEKDWLNIVNQCEANKYHNITVELLAAITVATALKMAASIIDDGGR